MPWEEDDGPKMELDDDITDRQPNPLKKIYQNIVIDLRMRRKGYQKSEMKRNYKTSEKHRHRREKKPETIVSGLKMGKKVDRGKCKKETT